MTRGVNSLFFARLQGDVIDLVELVKLQSKTKSWHWAVSNVDIVSSNQLYEPFPGATASGIEESTDLGIATIDFILANSGGAFDELLDGQDLDMATVTIRRVFASTPDLGDMQIFIGQIGDYSYNRQQIVGQVRDSFGGTNFKWPYYTYMDQCAWRFGSIGCAFDTDTIVVSGQLELSSANKLSVLVGSASLSNSGYIPGHFDKGRLTLLSGTNSGQIRTVRIHSGDQLDLSHSMPFNTTSGDFFTLFRGCRKRLIEDCGSVFDNTSNFLGFPWIPRQENAI